MKKIKLVLSILAILSLLLCGWSIYELTSEGGNIISASLNLIYFASLFIAFLCIRISTGISQKIEPVVTLIGVTVISLSTYTWINSTELLVLGKYTLGMFPLLIGTTLMLLVKSNSKSSKFIQAGIGLVVVSISTCVFLGVFGTSIYTILFIGMIAMSVAVLGYSFFAKTT
ncbi:MAG: hypothetical protein P8P74_03060 [Crocinitomicaceae bacterium]|nr:hypothetical protein [Crocinitomicaceae bacterium]